MSADRLIQTLITAPRHALETVRIWAEVHRRRAAMAATPADTLEDIGLTRAELEAEIARPFWDVTEAERAALTDPRSGGLAGGVSPVNPALACAR